MRSSLSVWCVVFLFFGVGESFANKEFPWQKPGGGPSRRIPDPPSDPLAGCPESLADGGYVLLAEALSKLSSDTGVSRRLSEVGVDITNVSWQDSGRNFGSAWGRNIADVRLLAITKTRDGRPRTHAQPIIRLPNFEDPTVDVDMDSVLLPFGNQWGQELFTVSLRDALDFVPFLLTNPELLKGESLYAPERDHQVLVGAQASLMPVPKQGEAHFAPAIYHYQSTAEHPAVLVMLVSNRGTSITVVDNARDQVPRIAGGSGSGQMLFFNGAGQKKPFTLEAKSEVAATAAGRERLADLAASGQAIGGQDGRVNQMMMIQIPLKYPEQRRRDVMMLEAIPMSMSATRSRSMRSAGPRGVDEGVVDVASYSLGPFVELNGKGSGLERDPSLPVRVDVVYYMATDTAELTGEEVAGLPEQFRSIYDSGANLGSLVTDPSWHRMTRDFEPWKQPWWNTVVVPYIPHGADPIAYLAKIYGKYWFLRFSSEGAARAALDAHGLSQ